jgi:hypothetical protein
MNLMLAFIFSTILIGLFVRRLGAREITGIAFLAAGMTVLYLVMPGAM